ncbi:hypothetical protein [Caulobacter phage Cr30]|uniref:hypothetical protein n=1 Tax=Caulobacter phage Cr30 TaxID=1357714 RepID=UPI0004A9B915|nr:hypothetical protein OZ74_gp082 [Caulobacter phage Cr30]AGS80967.1 hypothetical protein [Caulobacter phage Cr30]
MIEMLKAIATDVAPVGASRHAAAIVYRGEILSIGVNNHTAHPFQKKFSKHEDAIFLHAETDAIRKAIKKHGADILEKSTLYVARMKYTDTKKTKMVQGMSRPCIGCARCASTFGIKNVYYTTDEGYECL